MESLPTLLSDWVWIGFVFCIGACIGSLINVVVARLPLEKSILWPGSRCSSCLQPVAGIANIPIFSYLLLRGRCLNCGARFSSRYLWVELATALAFVALFWFDIGWNRHDLAFIRQAHSDLHAGWVPWRLWAYFGVHAVLMSFLIAASLCDLDGKVIPLPLTLTGTIIGLTFSTLMPWPWPSGVLEAAVLPGDEPWFLLDHNGKIPRGVQNWPFWGPLPAWLPPGSWQLGLLTGLIGAAAGNLMMRAVKFLFESGMGKEALGLGDADLMMMAGAFVGWQMIVASFFIGTFAALVLAVPMLMSKKERHLPFGPGLSIGVMIALLGWRWLGPAFQPFYFEWMTLFVAATILGGGMFVASLLLGQREKS